MIEQPSFRKIRSLETSFDVLSYVLLFFLLSALAWIANPYANASPTKRPHASTAKPSDPRTEPICLTREQWLRIREGQIRSQANIQRLQHQLRLQERKAKAEAEHLRSLAASERLACQQTLADLSRNPQPNACLVPWLLVGVSVGAGITGVVLAFTLRP